MSNEMDITIRKGPPGAQKTREMLRGVIRTPGLYLLAVPRIDLIAEQIKFLTEEAGKRLPPIREAHSGKRGKVQRRLDDAAREFASTSHAIVFVTHEGLRTSDLSAF